MQFSYKNAASAVVIFTIILTTILILIAYRNNKNNSYNSYTLKDYNGTVALFEGDRIITVYDGVVLSTLPYADRQRFLGGIIIQTPDQAEEIMEDYDG